MVNSPPPVGHAGGPPSGGFGGFTPSGSSPMMQIFMTEAMRKRHPGRRNRSQGRWLVLRTRPAVDDKRLHAANPRCPGHADGRGAGTLRVDLPRGRSEPPSCDIPRRVRRPHRQPRTTGGSVTSSDAGASPTLFGHLGVPSARPPRRGATRESRRRGRDAGGTRHGGFPAGHPLDGIRLCSSGVALSGPLALLRPSRPEGPAGRLPPYRPSGRRSRVRSRPSPSRLSRHDEHSAVSRGGCRLPPPWSRSPGRCARS